MGKSRNTTRESKAARKARRAMEKAELEAAVKEAQANGIATMKEEVKGPRRGYKIGWWEPRTKGQALGAEMRRLMNEQGFQIAADGTIITPHEQDLEE
jgi:hypothetical protein